LGYSQDNLVVPDAGTSQTSMTAKPNARSQSKFRSLRSLLEFLFMTSAIALSAGIGFGAAIRFGQPQPVNAKGESIPAEQSFPPRPDWPGSNPEKPSAP